MSLRGGQRPTWQSREGTAVPYRPSLKWHAPIASVAALTAQPLAALPPYGCGVPFTGSERLWQLQIGRYSRRTCKAPKFVIPRSEATWESREGSCVFADSFPTMRPGTARLPRRFAPRNDTSRGTGDVSYPPAVEWPARNACSILPDNKNPRRNRGIRISVVISARSPIGFGKKKSEPSVATRRLTDL